MYRKVFIWMGLGLLVLTLVLPLQTQAQGGCPPELPGTSAYTIVDAVLVASANPEQRSSDTPNTFGQAELHLHYQPGQRVFLSSVPDRLAPTCIDDYLRLESETGHIIFDYRSADRSRIEARAGLDAEITALLQPGDNQLRVQLVDVGAFYSNSTVYAVTLTGLPPLTPTRTPRTGTPTAMVEPTASATPTKTATATVQPTTTPTQTAKVLAATAPEEPVPVWPWSRLIVGLLVVIAALAILLLLRPRSAAAGRFPGELELFKAGAYVKTVILAHYKKAVITLGSGQVDIWLAGEGVPELAAKLFTKTADGQPSLFVSLTAADGEILDERRLYHDDSFYLGDYRLVYKNLTEENPLYLIGDLNNA